MKNLHRNTLHEPLTSQGQDSRFTLGSIDLPGIDEPDFQALFRQLPGVFIAIRPDFVIVAASDDMRRKTLTWREDIIGRSFFDVLPDNPSVTPGASRRMEASFCRVLADGAPHSLRLVRHDIQDRLSGNEGWIERFWTAINRPVIDNETGEVVYVLCEARDVTRIVHLSLWLDPTIPLGREMERSVRRVRSDVSSDPSQLARVRERIAGEMALTGARPETLVNELKALLGSSDSRLYGCAGEWVAETGVYVAYHRKGCHVAPRVRYFAEGTLFPGCESCSNDVLYRMSHTLSD